MRLSIEVVIVSRLEAIADEFCGVALGGGLIFTEGGVRSDTNDSITFSSGGVCFYHVLK